MIFKALFFLFLFSFPARAAEEASTSFLDKFPQLRRQLFEERETQLYFGLGISPLIIFGSRLGAGVSPFQLSWLTRLFDLEVLSISVGTTFSQPSNESKSNFYIFRTSPKFRLFKMLSIGPLIGLEYQQFTNLAAVIKKGIYQTEPATFTTAGYIYGAEASETITLSDSLHLRVSQVYYFEHYSTSETSNGWKYSFGASPVISANQDALAPGSVFMLEVSLEY